MVIGMTFNGGSTALPEESLAFAAEPEQGYELGALGTSDGGGNTCTNTRTWAEGEEEDVPNFETLPQDGRPFSGESRVFCFTLRDFRDSVSTRAKSSLLVGLMAGGPSCENFIREGGEGLKVAGLEDLEPEDPGTSDLISFE